METQKLTVKELQDLKNIQAENNQIITSLGQVEVQKAILEDQKKEHLNQFAELQEKQSKLANELQEKYGVGNINIETGEFTKIE